MLSLMGLLTASTWKLAAMAGCVGGAYYTYNTMPEPKYRAQLRKLFKEGQIFIKRKVRDKEVLVYPKIRRVTLHSDRIKFYFSLPNGLNPAKVLDNDFLFQQGFGPLTSLDVSSAKWVTLTVYRKDLEQFNYSFEDVEDKASKMKVPIYIGKNFDGQYLYDMADYPHLLITGETGSGKSTALRSVNTCIVQSMPPEKLKLYCADLKRSEFHVFNGVAEQVVYEPKDMEIMLRKITKEMEKRGERLNEEGQANVFDLADPPPSIVLCVDEVALIRKEKELMEQIERIGMIGRALGVFLILSMQRADANVLEGRLKQCLTVRVSFRQPDSVNSSIAIGSNDAAHIKLSERGRLMIRHETLEMMQAPFLDLFTARRLLEPFRKPQLETRKHGKKGKSDPIDVEFQVLDDDTLGELNNETEG